MKNQNETRQQRDKRIRDSMRFLSAFGQRESEIAAIIIYDRYAKAEPQPVDPALFVGDTDATYGFEDLKRSGWIDAGNIPSARFWQRCHEVQARDEAGYRGGPQPIPDAERCQVREGDRRCTGARFHAESMNATPHTF